MAGGGLKVGDLFVVLTANVSQFQKSMSKVIKTVEATAAKIEAIGAKIGQFGAVASAGIAGAIAAAAKANPQMAAEVEKLKQLLFTLAVEIGETFKPVLDKIVAFVERAVAAWQQMSPAMKESLAHGATLVATIGLAAGAIGKFAGLGGAVVKGLGLAIEGIGALIGSSLIVPIGIAIAIAGGLFLVAGLIREAWDENLGGIQEKFGAVWEWISKAAKVVWDSFKDSIRLLTEWFTKGLDFIRNQFNSWAVGVINTVSKIASFFDKDLAANLRITGLEILKDINKAYSFEGLKDLGSGALKLFDFAKSGMSKNLSDLGSAAKSLAEKLKELTGIDILGLLGGKGGKARIRSSLGEAPVVVGHVSSEGPALREAVSLSRGTDWNKVVDDMLARRAKEAADAAKGRLADRITSALGDAFSGVKSIIQNAMDASAGGPLAVIGSVVGDLLLQSQSFGQIVSMVTNFVQVIANALGKVLAPVLPILASVFDAVAPLFEGVMNGIAAFLAPLSTISGPLQALSAITKALSPVLNLLTQGLLLLSAPLMLLVGPVMNGLFQVLKYGGVAIIWVVARIGDLWNGLVSAVQALLGSLASIDIAGAKPFAFLSDWAKSMDHAKMDVKALNKAQDDLLNLSFDTAIDAGKMAVDKWVNFGNEMSDAADQLSNVPTGWKVDLAKWRATDPMGALAGSSSSSSTYEDNSTTNITVNVTTSGDSAQETADDVAKALKHELKKDNARKKGGYKQSDEGLED